jgi:hypothetical protein
LVHKISAYKYIYENGEKKWEKKKKKEVPASWAGGDFGPPGRERARGRACGPAAVHGRGDGAGARVRGSDGVTAGPHVSESGGRGTAPRSDGAGEPDVRGERTRSPVGSTAIRRRWPGSWSMGRWLSTGRG